MRKPHVNTERLKDREQTGTGRRTGPRSSKSPVGQLGLILSPPVHSSLGQHGAGAVLQIRVFLGACWGNAFSGTRVMLKVHCQLAAWPIFTCQVHELQTYSNKSTSNKAWSFVLREWWHINGFFLPELISARVLPPSFQLHISPPVPTGGGETLRFVPFVVTQPPPILYEFFGANIWWPFSLPLGV